MPDRRAAALALTVVLVLSAGACGRGDDAETASTDPAPESLTSLRPEGPSPSPGCNGGTEVEPGTSEHTMRTSGRQRQYRLIVPQGYEGRTPLPLVMGLHTLGGSHVVVAHGTGLAAMAATYDFVAVMPAGLTDPVSHWLAAPVEPNHDVTFIAELLDRIGNELCLDTTKVFATGLSNGGQMSSVLACRLWERFTAVAPVAGAEFSEACDGDPVAVMAFHGDADEIVAYDGSGLNGATIAAQALGHGELSQDVPEHRGVDDAMANWARHNGCEPTPDEERLSPEVRRRVWRGCDAATVLYVIEGGGHTWPGRPGPGSEDTYGHTTTDIDATALMFEFFLGRPNP